MWGCLAAAAAGHAQADAPAHDAVLDRDRSDDRLYVAGGAFMLGAGARAGAYVTPDVAVDLDGQVAAVLFMGASLSMAAGVHYFLGETAYVRAALRVRRMTLSLEPFWGGDDDELDEWLYQTDVGPDLAIGHRWQWGAFFLAVEWAALYFPAIALDVEQRTIDPQNDEILRRGHRGAKLYPHTRALFLQLGASL